jgi:hypothetical protein
MGPPHARAPGARDPDESVNEHRRAQASWWSKTMVPICQLSSWRAASSGLAIPFIGESRPVHPRLGAPPADSIGHGPLKPRPESVLSSSVVLHSVERRWPALSARLCSLPALAAKCCSAAGDQQCNRAEFFCGGAIMAGHIMLHGAAEVSLRCDNPVRPRPPRAMERGTAVPDRGSARSDADRRRSTGLSAPQPA